MTSLAVLPSGVCSRSECGLLSSLCFLLSHLVSQVHRRQKQLEVESRKGDFVSTKRYWTLPKSCGSQSSEWEERKKSRVGSGSLCEPRKSRKTVTPATDCCLFPLVEKGNVAGCLQLRRPRRTETCMILSCLLFFGSPLWTGNHCGSRSTAVEAPEHSRAVGRQSFAHFRVSLRHDTTYDQASLRHHQAHSSF